MFTKIKRLFNSQNIDYIRSLPEFYQNMEHLIESLNDLGLEKEVKKLNTVIHEIAWTTSSELIGEIGVTLKNMQGEYPQNISKIMDQCLAFSSHHRKILGLDKHQ